MNKEVHIKSGKNETYRSDASFHNVLTVLNRYLENKVLEKVKTSHFTLFHDETTDISNSSQANVYVMIPHEEHYLGLINMNKYAGRKASDFYESLLELFRKKGIELENCDFSDLDGCPTNQGARKGLKQYLFYHNPHHISEVCNSHSLALIMKHLIEEDAYKVVADADHLIVSLYQLFKNSSVKTSIFEQSQFVCLDKSYKLICPSATRWLSHRAGFVRLLQVIEPTIASLASLYHERNDMEAFGILMNIIDPQFLLTVLMLVDVLNSINMLTLWLQTSPSSAEITQLSPVVQKVLNKLRYLCTGEDSLRSSFTKEEIENFKFTEVIFIDLSNKVMELVESLPVATRLRNAVKRGKLNLMFIQFKQDVFVPFIEDLVNQIETNLSIHPVCQAFSCLDPKNFQEDNIPEFGMNEMEVLKAHYGGVKQASTN